MDKDLNNLIFASGLAYDLHIEGCNESEILNMIDDPQYGLINEWAEA